MIYRSPRGKGLQKFLQERTTAQFGPKLPIFDVSRRNGGHGVVRSCKNGSRLNLAESAAARCPCSCYQPARKLKTLGLRKNGGSSRWSKGFGIFVDDRFELPRVLSEPRWLKAVGNAQSVARQGAR